ncbi:S-layer homology domain-containing protein [Paenibacillus guangzhouensis]|uniref:S-layer homology domain-containing protein n=1 Tax=Paenibacillus guangzhouensis TaxID=1473112 RepID=UPI0012669D8B|nr:S-layer homology domain-containing protein [Paenibacillus guangzhouensis]
MRKVMVSTMAAAILVGGCMATPPSQVKATATNNAMSSTNSSFKDVPATHWAVAAIASAVQDGYFKGYTDGTFKPNAPVTKAEMATILGRLSEQPVVAAGANSDFSDLLDWAKDGVQAAVEKGFIDPAKYAGTLNAKAALTRGEMATWLAQGLAAVSPDYKQALSDVTDTVIPAKEYFTGKMSADQKNAVAVTMGTGLMSVGSDKNFGTDRTTTRAEVATLLARYTAVAKKQPSEFQGLEELRAVGLTGTNIKVIAPSYVKQPQESWPESFDYNKVTDDFTKVRNKELVTDTDYATLKVRNWIVVNPYVKGDQRSIYYPVFLDNGDTLNNGAYYSFTEFDLNVKMTSMNQLQAGSLLSSSTINPLKSPTSKAVLEYSLPLINDFTKSRGVFTVKNPIYWSRGLLQLDKAHQPFVRLKTKDGLDFAILSIN